MGATTAKRCEECNAPLLSALERDLGRCTACLRADRADETQAAKPLPLPAKPVPPDVNTTRASVNIEGQANSVLMACRVTPATYAKALERIERSGETQSGWLRGLIEQALT